MLSHVLQEPQDRVARCGKSILESVTLTERVIMTEFTEAEALKFLDWLADKGLAHPGTVKTRKIAVARILGVLDDGEKRDLRTLDRDAVFRRFVNKNARDFSPASLQTYRSRFDTALDDFFRYCENPAAFRPAPVRGPRQARPQETTDARSAATSLTQRAVPVAPLHTILPNTQTVSVPFPVRVGHVIHLQNVPADLTVDEAQRLGRFILAMVPSRENNRGTDNEPT
jgi:hypothetical protein